MTLTVRLDPTLDTALERYCAATGSSKSLVVQESLAAYLVTRTQPAARAVAGAAPSANFRAFADAGLVGVIAVGGGADKAAVRARATARGALRKPAPRKA